MSGIARKTVTVLFCDVAGSTALGERLDPESLRRVMSRYFEQTRSVLERHGGTVEKFIGDAVMAVFGIPVLHEDDALRAVWAAAEIQAALTELNEELERGFGLTIAVRTGLNTGEVVAGDPSVGQALVTGDAVNVAARLEQAAQPGEILMGEDTYRLVRDAVRAEPVEPLALKGKAGAVRARRLVEVVPGAPAFARRLDTPMVGRSRELARLREAFDQAAQERSARLVTVLGPPGIGKSRLAAELRAAVEAKATVLAGRCLPYGEGITFWPLAEAVRGLSVREVLRGDEDAELVESRIEGAAGSVEETFWAVRRLFEALARERPLVVVFEDVHWGEPTFLDLLEYLAEWTREAPLLVLCLARSEFLDKRPGWGGERLPLEPLNEGEAQMLIENLLAGAELAAATRDRIAEAAEGNPLFVEQMLAMISEDGHPAEELAVPPTIQALLAARLDRLDPGERMVIERAAVVGKVFYWGAVAHLCPGEARPRVGSHLLALMRKDLIGPERSDLSHEDAFRFRHILIRDAAYAGMPKAVRAELHERFAGWLEGRAVEADEIVGYHLEQAYRSREELGTVGAEERALAARAAERLAAGGRRAFARMDMPAAVSLLTRATSLLAPADPARLELLPELAAALAETGELARAQAVVEEAIESARAAGDRRVERRAIVELAQLRSATDPTVTVADTFAQARRAIAELEQLGDDVGLARAWWLAGFMEGARGRAGRSAAALERALAHAERAGAAREANRCFALLTGAVYYGPTPVAEGIAACARYLEQGRGNRHVEASVLRILGAFAGMEGRFEEGREMLDRAKEIVEELGLTIRAAEMAFWRGPLELWAGDPAAAERVLRESHETLDARREKAFLSTIAAHLAEAIYAQGRLDEAEAFTRVSEEAAAPDDLASQIGWRQVRAKVLARRGAHAEAEALAREAVAVAEGTEYIHVHADALADLAEVLGLAGRAREAVDAAEKALALYQSKGHLVSAERARARLAELATARTG